MKVRRRTAVFCVAAFGIAAAAYGVNGVMPLSRADAVPGRGHRTLDVSSSAAYVNPNWSRALVHQRIKHVFVLVQENHTFDNYFGLYPGQGGQRVENLGSPIAQADDCVPDPEAGSGACQRPFLITTKTSNTRHYVPDAPDITDGANDRFGQQYAVNGGKMNGFIVENEASDPLTSFPTPLPVNPALADVENHNDALDIMTTYDCDTVPYLWFYAKNFALFDHYFQANTGDSTPANIQLFAAQIGQTEVAAGKAPFGVSTFSPTAVGYTNGLPIGNDNNPPPGQLPFMTSYTGATPQQSISVASLPMLLNPKQDAAAISRGVEGLIPEDFWLEANARRPAFPWAWYEEGTYAGDGVPNAFSPHHEAPLYFDYINNAKSPFGTPGTLRDNTVTNGLLNDIESGALPSEGVFWVKGGAHATSFPFKPADPALSTIYVGTDDHPGTDASDHQVGEAYVATLVNAIAKSKYWNDSVIILTWDDSGGMYDHVPPPKYGPPCPDDRTGTFAGTACGDGVRLPLLVISPFAKRGAVVHDASDAGSIAKFIEDVFDLPPLASLPEEAAGVRDGLAPADVNPYTGDLIGALDLERLWRNDPSRPWSETLVPSPSVPPAMSCASLGIVPLSSPGSVPKGFETAGWYAGHTSSAAAVRRSAPRHSDAGD
jgi:phospholipase C